MRRRPTRPRVFLAARRPRRDEAGPHARVVGPGVHPLDDQAAVLFGHADDVADDARRDGVGDLGDEVAARTRGDDAVDDAVDVGGDVLLALVEHPGVKARAMMRRRRPCWGSSRFTIELPKTYFAQNGGGGIDTDG